MALCQ